MTFLSLNRFKHDLSISQQLLFPQGIYGFEEERVFSLSPSKTSPYLLFQSRRTLEIAFLVVDPFCIHPEFNPEITKNDLDNIGVADEATLLLLSIVNKKTTPISLNLKAPLLIDWDQRLGCQIVL